MFLDGNKTVYLYLHGSVLYKLPFQPFLLFFPGLVHEILLGEH